MFEHLERGDGVREPIIKKFDNVVVNPPFNVEGMKYYLKYNFTDKYIPIDTDNTISLFIQAIIYMLKINGKS